MATSDKQDRDFLDKVISKTLLEESMDWIRTHLSPEQMFSERSLAAWAEANGYVQADSVPFPEEE